MAKYWLIDVPLVESRRMMNDITQFNVNSYTNQIERAQMILDLINEAEDTEKN